MIDTSRGNWVQKYTGLHKLLKNLSVRDGKSRSLGQEEGFGIWCDYSKTIKAAQKQIFLIGNGASSSMASHFATDIVKNVGIRARVFTDSSLVTAIGNDMSFNDVYAEPLRWNGNAGDLLVAISSSGNSPNIIRAIQVAKEMKMVIVTLSAMAEDNTIRSMGDLNFYIAAGTYGLAESSHAVILHHWVDLLGEIYG
jgi:D-sedoheptulose 7-phosphate isomerase